MIRSIAILAALLFSVGAIAGHHAESVAVPGSDVRVHEANGVRYVSGGVGDTEQAAIERNFGDYALKVINVRAEPNGQAYVSDVKVWLGHANGEKILQTRTGGPWLLADLAPGKYQLRAWFKGEEQRRDFSIGPAGRQRVLLLWNNAR